MLGRLVLGRLSTELSKTRPYDVTHLPQKLAICRNAFNSYTASKRLLHTSIRFQAPRGAAAAGKPVKAGRATAKSSASKRAPKKKAATSKKSDGRKKAATKAKKRPVKRVPSEKSKEKLAAKKQRDKVKELKELALLSSEPSSTAINAWLVLSTEHLKSSKDRIPVAVKESAARYKNLAPSEREHYNHLANERNAAIQSEYQQWVHSHTPERIREANVARASLRRMLTTTSANPGHKQRPKHRGKIIRAIDDDRTVKRARGPYTYFFMERHDSGDMKAVPVSEAAKLISKEWKALTPAEKAKYENLHNEDLARYTREYKDVYGHDYKKAPRKSRQSA